MYSKRIEKDIYIDRWVKLGLSIFLRNEKNKLQIEEQIAKQEIEMLDNGFSHSDLDAFSKLALEKIKKADNG